MIVQVKDTINHVYLAWTNLGYIKLHWQIVSWSYLV